MVSDSTQAVGEAIDCFTKQSIASRSNCFVSPTYKDSSLIPLVIKNNVFVHHCELAAWVEAGHPDSFQPTTQPHPIPTQLPSPIHHPHVQHHVTPTTTTHPTQTEAGAIMQRREGELVSLTSKRGRERDGWVGADTTIRKQASGSTNATIN